MPAASVVSVPDLQVPILRDRLIAWCNQNSGSDHLEGLAKMIALLERAFAPLGDTIECVTLPGTPARALRVRRRAHAPVQVLFSGHYDTVYGATHPFQTCTQPEPDLLRGPGVADMKGGIVVMLAALEALEQFSERAQIGWEVLLSPDEEIGSAATRTELEAAARRHHFGLVFEPCRENGDLVKSRKGTGIFTLTCHGRAAHAGRGPEAGRNAILALAEYLPHVDALNRELPGVMLNIGRIQGGGAVNIVPDLAMADVNIRTTRLADEKLVLDRLHGLAAPINAREGYRLEIEGRFNRPPKETRTEEEALFAAWQACGREAGLDFSWQHVGGGSDGNLLSAAGLPVLDGLGPQGGNLHSAEEYVRISSLVQRAHVGIRFLAKLAARQIHVPLRAIERTSPS